MNTGQQLLDQFGRAQLGVDGNAAFVLLGPDIQEGEAEFVTIPDDWENRWDTMIVAEMACAKTALKRLRDRLGMSFIPFYFGPSHPYGN